MSDKSILGGKVANAIYIHQEALHLTLEPKMMLMLLLMQGHKKFFGHLGPESASEASVQWCSQWLQLMRDEADEYFQPSDRHA